MKKFLALMLSVLMLGLLIAGCGQQAAPSSDAPAGDEPATPASEAGGDAQTGSDVTLKLWVLPFGVGEGSDAEVWDETLSTFTGANVKYEIIGWENYSEKLLTAISTGTGPDVTYMYNDIYADFIDMGAVAALDEYVTDEDREKFNYLDWGIKFGKMYGYPFIVGNPRVLFYNPKMLKDAGVEPPETWDDFLEACIATTKDTDGDGELDQWGFAGAFAENFYGLSVNVFNLWLWQNGGELFNEDGTKCTFNSPEGIEAAQFMYDLLHKHKVMPENTTGLDQNQVMEMFTHDQLAFNIAPSTDVARIKSSNPDFEWDYVPSLSKQTVGTFIAADQLAVMESCENKDVAVDLIRHILRGDNMENFHTKLSAFVPIANDEPFVDDPRFEPMFENPDPDLFRQVPSVVNSFMVYEYLWKQYQSMMMGEVTPEEALNESARYGDDILAGN